MTERSRMIKGLGKSRMAKCENFWDDAPDTLEFWSKSPWVNWDEGGATNWIWCTGDDDWDLSLTENRKVRLDNLKLFIDMLIEDADGYNKVTGK